MKETTTIVTMMTGDVMHSEYLHGDIERVTEKIRALEKGHTILSISVKDGDSFKRLFDAKDPEKGQFTRRL